MKIFLIAIAAAVAAFASQANAVTIAYDGFTGRVVYPDGATNLGYGAGFGPNDGTGFTAGWQNGNFTSPRTSVAGLTYTGLQTSGYGAASPAYIPSPTPGTYYYNSTALRSFSSNPATTNLWMSFLIQSNGISSANFSAYPNYGGLRINDGSGNNIVFAGVPGVQPTGTADYSLQTSTIASSAKAAASGQTDLLVVDLSNDGHAYLYVDPTIGSPLGAPDATIAVSEGPSAAAGLYWTDSWGWTYSDIRVGTTLADVTPAATIPTAVPEPATWAMLILGMGAMGAVLRRRREGAFTAA